MIQIRIVTPTDATDHIVAYLDDEPASTSLSVIPGAARKPRGDVVVCDIGRRDADHILHGLAELELRHGIDLTISVVDAHSAQSSTTHDRRESGVIWTQVVDNVVREARLTPSHLVLMAVASLIAAVGIVQDQPILIVGAMVVSPDYYPVAGICLGLAHVRDAGVYQPLRTLTAGLGVAIIAAFLCGYFVTVARVLPPPDVLAQNRSLTSFIAKPDGWSVFVALLAGIAGMVSLARSEIGALVGVVISVTTIPAAANLGLAFAVHDTPQIIGSATQLAVNVVFLLVGGAVTALFLKTYWRRRHPDLAVPTYDASSHGSDPTGTFATPPNPK